MACASRRPSENRSFSSPSTLSVSPCRMAHTRNALTLPSGRGTSRLTVLQKRIHCEPLSWISRCSMDTSSHSRSNKNIASDILPCYVWKPVSKRELENRLVLEVAVRVKFHLLPEKCTSDTYVKPVGTDPIEAVDNRQESM